MIDKGCLMENIDEKLAELEEMQKALNKERKRLILKKLLQKVQSYDRTRKE